MAGALLEGGAGLFEERRADVLCDEEATVQGIETAVERVIDETRPADTFVFAGFGYVDIGGQAGRPEFYVVPSGGSFPFRLGRDPITGVAGGILIESRSPGANVSGQHLKVWLSKIEARRQMVLLDTCHSDALLDMLASRLPERDPLVRTLLDRDLVLLGPEGSATELAEFGHGAYTQAVLEGLSGQADITRDGLVTARELQAFVAPKAIELTQGAALSSSYAVGDDFPVARVANAGEGPPVRGAELAPVADEEERQPGSEAKGEDYALLFAIDEYDQWQTLVNPVQDASTIASELQDSYGFEVELIRNPTRAELRAAIKRYAQRKYGPDDQLLVFFAGHGAYDDAFKKGYLVTKDSLREDPGRDTYTAHASASFTSPRR